MYLVLVWCDIVNSLGFGKVVLVEGVSNGSCNDASHIQVWVV